eukprot:TRINITY_DN3243_c0_g2_i3.p1 TRINITY_DN3243_c0_g2~~TRINITY_DN3243_c0_g2_i3.p1  ORF type:complete len:347 (-),score=4.79 TRINITY_DN3243_c0_g2_i3:297-1337(-)
MFLLMELVYRSTVAYSMQPVRQKWQVRRLPPLPCLLCRLLVSHRGVSKWVLAGIGSGARVAAVVASRCRGQICGFIFLSYPFGERIPSSKQSSDNFFSPLARLDQPTLFIHTMFDELAPLEALKKYCAERPAVDTRLLLIRDTDNKFRDCQGSGPKLDVMIRISEGATTFLNALHDETLLNCALPKPEQVNTTSLESQEMCYQEEDCRNKINHHLQSFGTQSVSSIIYGQNYNPQILPSSQLSLQSLLERPQVTTGSSGGQFSEVFHSFGQYLNSQLGAQRAIIRGSANCQSFFSQLSHKQSQSSNNGFAQYFQQWTLRQQQHQQLQSRYQQLSRHGKKLKEENRK